MKALISTTKDNKGLVEVALPKQLICTEVFYTMADKSVTTEFLYTLLLIFFCFFCILRCKKHEVPVEKVYNKTQREKFAWALDMAEKDFVF